MKNAILLYAIIVIILIGGFIASMYIHLDESNIPELTTTKLLKTLPEHTKDTYMLVRWDVVKDTFNVIIDHKLLFDNKNVFTIKNNREVYGVTCEIVFSLYKNGKKISYEISAGEPLTKINYGTLENAFTHMNREEFDTLIQKQLNQSS